MATVKLICVLKKRRPAVTWGGWVVSSAGQGGGKTAGHPCLSGMWLQGSRLCASSGKLERLQQACPRGARPLGALEVSIPEPTGTDYVLRACMVLWVALPL